MGLRTSGISPLTHCPLGDLDAILKMQFSTSICSLVSSDIPNLTPLDESHTTLLAISQGNKPLPEPMLTQFMDAYMRH